MHVSVDEELMYDYKSHSNECIHLTSSFLYQEQEMESKKQTVVKEEHETKGNEKGTIGTLSMSDTRGSGVGGVDRVGDVDPVSCSGGGGDLVNRGSITAKASNESSSIVLPRVVAHPMAIGREGSSGSGGSGDGAGRGGTCSVSGCPDAGDVDGGDAPSYTAYSKVVLSSRADMSALSSV